MTRHVPLATLAASFGCLLAFGCAPRSSESPVWRLADAPGRQVGCAEVEAWIVKSGRQGVGVTLQLSSPEAGCAVQLKRAAISLQGEAEHLPAQRPDGAVVVGPKPVHFYLAFPFDNLSSWRRGLRQGELTLSLTAALAAAPLQVSTDSATILRLPMRYRPAPAAWMVNVGAFMDSHPANLTGRTDGGRHLSDQKWSCAWIGWEGADGTDRYLRAMLNLGTDEPSCTVGLRGAKLVWGKDSIGASNHERPLTITKEQGAFVSLEFAIPPHVHPDEALLSVELENARGVSIPLEWPLCLPSPTTNDCDARKAR